MPTGFREPGSHNEFFDIRGHKLGLTRWYLLVLLDSPPTRVEITLVRGDSRQPSHQREVKSHKESASIITDIPEMLFSFFFLFQLIIAAWSFIKKIWKESNLVLLRSIPQKSCIVGRVLQMVLLRKEIKSVEGKKEEHAEANNEKIVLLMK